MLFDQYPHSNEELCYYKYVPYAMDINPNTIAIQHTTGHLGHYYKGHVSVCTGCPHNLFV